MYLTKKVKSSVLAVNKNEDCTVQCILCQLDFWLKQKRTSKAIIKRYTDTGSPWWAPLFNVRYWVAKPLFITQDCRSFNNILTQLIKLSPKPNSFKMHNKK